MNSLQLTNLLIKKQNEHFGFALRLVDLSLYYGKVLKSGPFTTQDKDFIFFISSN